MKLLELLFFICEELGKAHRLGNIVVLIILRKFQQIYVGCLKLHVNVFGSARLFPSAIF